nr:hypothetical protein [Micromonospora sp. DSM 115978]
FLVNAPLGLAVFVFGLLFLDTYRSAGAGRFDLVGFLLAALGFSAVLYALTTGPERGGAAGATLGPLVVGVAATAFMIRWEVRRREPLIAFRVLRNRLFRATNVSASFVTMSFLGMLFLVPLMVQTAAGGSGASSSVPPARPAARGGSRPSRPVVAPQPTPAPQPPPPTPVAPPDPDPTVPPPS